MDEDVESGGLFNSNYGQDMGGTPSPNFNMGTVDGGLNSVGGPNQGPLFNGLETGKVDGGMDSIDSAGGIHTDDVFEHLGVQPPNRGEGGPSEMARAQPGQFLKNGQDVQLNQSTINDMPKSWLTPSNIPVHNQMQPQDQQQQAPTNVPPPNQTQGQQPEPGQQSAPNSATIKDLFNTAPVQQSYQFQKTDPPSVNIQQPQNNVSQINTQQFEGWRPNAYMDTKGNSTIGYGHNLKGGNNANVSSLGLDPAALRSGQAALSKDQGNQLFNLDMNDAKATAQKLVPNYDSLHPTVKNVVNDMAYNLGPQGLKQFSPTMQLISAGKYNEAADHIQKSPYYKQTGNRAKTIVNTLRGMQPNGYLQNLLNSGN